MLCQKLPPDFVEKFAPFLGQVIQLHKMNDYLLSKVRNPDESPTYFHMLSNYSGDGNSVKSVVVPSGNNMLAVLTDGSKSSDHHM